MKTWRLTLIAACLLALPASVSAQQLVVQPNPQVISGAVYTYPNGFYSPYPGIWAPRPYPNFNYPPHWIYSYMRFDDGNYRQDRRDDEAVGSTYRGRETVPPAVPYSDYLKSQKELLKARDIAATPAPTADKALLEITLPNDKAKIFFDGKEAAAGEGKTRLFYTPALKTGQTYTFTVRATWPAFPDDASSEQTVSFKAGERVPIDLRPKN